MALPLPATGYFVGFPWSQRHFTGAPGRSVRGSRPRRGSLWFPPQPRRPLGAPPAAAAARWAPAGARKGLLGGLFRRLVLSGLVLLSLFFFPFIFIRWRLITLQYCSGFCHTLTWISHASPCVPHPEPLLHPPPHPIPLGLPSAPALSTCLMHPTWAGDLFRPW